MIVAGSGSSMFVRNSAATLTIAVFVYPMSENLGWSRTTIVGASSLAGILAIFASPLSGWLIQKYGTKITLLISVLLLGLSTALLSQTFSPIMFYILFGISRIIFSSPIQIGATTVVTKWFSKNRGNDLSTPQPELGFNGLKEGDKWCLCANRWLEAYQHDMAPYVILKSTNQKSLEVIDLDYLKKFAIDIS